jgi:hypothetical protein
MQRLVISLLATAGLVLASSMWVVHATPLTVGIPSQEFSPIQKVGCERAGDNCPYGYRIERHGGHGWSCEPCWQQKHGYNQRHYRDYGDRDENYEPRRYRQYDDGDYEGPRRYRNY